MNCICGKCGLMNSKIKKKEGGRSFILFFILLLFAIVPGLLYWGFAKKSSIRVICSGCGTENEFYNLNTPMGKNLKTKFYS